VVVAADVVAEQVVGEQHVSSPAVDLGGLGQVDVGVATSGGERVGTVLGEEGGVGEVGAGPDPQVPAVVGELVVEQQPRQQREGTGRLLVGCVAVDVRPARAVWVGPNVERYLGLVEGNVHTGGADELPGGVEDAVGAAEKLEQRRGLGGPPPVEVVAEVSPRRGSVGEEMVELGVGPVQVLRVDQAGDDQVAVFGEAVELFAGQGGHDAVGASDRGPLKPRLPSASGKTRAA
jgi:hypothetical protein